MKNRTSISHHAAETFCRCKSLPASLVSFAVHAVFMVAFASLYLPTLSQYGHEIVLAVDKKQPEVELEILELKLSTESVAAQATPNAVFHRATTTDSAVGQIRLPNIDQPMHGERESSAAASVASIDLLSPVAAKPERNYETYFFGIPAQGRRFVYILDMSTSMRERNAMGFSRFQVAAKELLRAVEALDEQQEFLVVAFCYDSFFCAPNPTKPTMLQATEENKRRLQSWIYQLRLSSGTDPRTGVVTGLRLDPDAIFLLSDGEFNGQRKNRQNIAGNMSTEQLIVRNRKQKTPIHTIAFDEDESRIRLAAIAKATGGAHRFIEN